MLSPGLTNYIIRYKPKYDNMMSLPQALFASTKPQCLTSLANPLHQCLFKGYTLRVFTFYV